MIFRVTAPRKAAQRSLVFACLLLGLLLGGCVTAPTEYRAPAPLGAAARQEFNLQVYDAAWRLVNEKYFDPQFRGVDWAAMKAKYRDEAALAPDDAALYRTLGKLCAELKESHLTPLSPRRVHEMRTEHRVAIGMRWRQIGGRRVVTDVLPGSPAAQAGVQPGWILQSRDGQPIDDKRPYVAHLGQPVVYGFLDRHDQPRTLTFEPQLLDFEQTVARELPRGWRYLRFDRFSPESLHWLSQQLKAHRDAPGVVLDLRQNPGGFALANEIAVAEFFEHRVDTGRFVRRNGDERDRKALPLFSAHYGGRVVILIGAGTASAAEIFSHVLHFHGRAILVGQKTAGAVILSRDYSLPGGGKLQVPVQDYVGLDGQRLEGRGVAPDVVVPPASLADLRSDRDPELEAALKVTGE